MSWLEKRVEKLMADGPTNEEIMTIAREFAERAARHVHDAWAEAEGETYGYNIAEALAAAERDE